MAGLVSETESHTNNVDNTENCQSEYHSFVIFNFHRFHCSNLFSDNDCTYFIFIFYFSQFSIEIVWSRHTHTQMMLIILCLGKNGFVFVYSMIRTFRLLIQMFMFCFIYPLLLLAILPRVCWPRTKSLLCLYISIYNFFFASHNSNWPNQSVVTCRGTSTSQLFVCSQNA